jgi:hypothetical protein
MEDVNLISRPKDTGPRDINTFIASTASMQSSLRRFRDEALALVRELCRRQGVLQAIILAACFNELQSA